MAVFIFVIEFDLELHAAHLALRPTLRQHPRRPPDHPVHGRRPRVLLGIAALGVVHAAGRRSSSSSSRSAWSPRCRPSSSPPLPRSTSAARSPRITSPKEHHHVCSPLIVSSSPRRPTDDGEGRQGHRARRRRRPRRRRRRRRHRHHLRQGHRVGDPPARDARRDHLDPVARLRAHRGVLLLRPRRRA